MQHCINKCFPHIELHKQQTINNESLINTANKLQIILLNRIEKHMREKVNDKQQDHWINHFIKSNACVLSLIMLKANHISENFYLKDMNDSILASVNNFLIAAFNGNDKYEGCYMFYNKQEGMFIRSRKAVGINRNIGRRLKEHDKNFQNGSVDSNFYIEYLKNYKGLQSYVALGFIREENVYPILTSDIRNSGLLFWDKNVINNLQGFVKCNCFLI